jgi:SHAQKYF class myb-like DNA-binding protein
VRLFGVRLTDGVMRKSVSMGNLSHYASPNNPPSPPSHSESGAAGDGYVSDGLVQTSNNTRERKKGVPWTEEEHRLFLLGLQKLGKGDWRGISRNFVQTRTPTQVASHAQKYFIRQSNMNKRKRRSSLFDIVSEAGPAPILEEPATKAVPDMSAPLHQLSLGPNTMYPGIYYDANNPHFRPYLLPPSSMAVPIMSMGPVSLGATEKIPETSAVTFSGDAARAVLPRPVTVSGPNGTPMAIPYPIPLWSMSMLPRGYNRADSKVLRPTAKLSTEPLNVGVNETKEMSQLNLGLSAPEPSQLTLKLLDQPSRSSSAFHVSTSSINSSNNAIGVV